MAIQHRMDGAFGGDFDPGEPATEALSDLVGTPTGGLALDVEDQAPTRSAEIEVVPQADECDTTCLEFGLTLIFRPRCILAWRSSLAGLCILARAMAPNKSESTEQSSRHHDPTLLDSSDGAFFVEHNMLGFSLIEDPSQTARKRKPMLRLDSCPLIVQEGCYHKSAVESSKLA
jgi:hypothetical protein